ncbi:rhomboid family intramembrane serine protease [Aureibaculum sp. 2210JD6-5]|uniref:rhomboid family intramembrane serine protease n=1 Tax=Aureibaculum sp. 2210JD6-5 TaxID=3103957 RepID=UPI002AAE4B33|nr:rhomboid family intramembrane serine protease [Aureibaculum sp. 2210JD6-5]MDY7395188.1 rhomboid family intramembrane serine protease [Aureibaculum sp. 2210JD6-5]
MGRITDTVKHIIIINVLLYLVAKFAYPPLQDLFALHFPENPNFGLWQYITHMFMHSQQSLMHIAFNMLGVYMFGSPLEQLWGRNKFLFFYFSAGIGAALIYTGVNYIQYNMAIQELLQLGITNSQISDLMINGNPNKNKALFTAMKIFHTPAVGASGALYGILVAFGMKFPNAKLALIFFPVPIAAKYFIPVLIGLDLFSGFTGYSIFGAGIAHFAHVGGAIVGLIIVLFWKQNQFKRWDK